MASRLSFLIQKKNQSQPFHVYIEDVPEIHSDIDHFPYLQFYRGKYLDSTPHVFDRNAGYSLSKQIRYELPVVDDKPHHSFQTACNTILPCHSKKSTCLGNIAYY